MNNSLNIAIAQINFLVGDIEMNAERVRRAIDDARSRQADVIIFPELTLTGYPPEDLLFRNGLYERLDKVIEKIKQVTFDIDVLIGHPRLASDERFNSASFIRNGNIIATYDKQCLPNYGVFDEARYFKAGSKPCVVDIKGVPTAITLCEDLWFEPPMQQAKDAGAALMLCLNASPFDRHKRLEREEAIADAAIKGNMPIIYANLIGGQDELVFDGGSMAINADGSLAHHAPFFEEALEIVTLETSSGHFTTGQISPHVSEEESLYRALVLGVQDYIEKNQFSSAVIGLSGGIDSALTLAIAADAIGSDRVEAVMMPSRYTRDISLTDAKIQADMLDIKHTLIPIEPLFHAFLDSLHDEFKGLPPDTTEENLQARCRGTLLMAISNKKGSIVLSTGNKSELSVGYSTLYGDMVGGFCVLKDVPKTWVYRLAKYRNSLGEVIPERVIERPPSAELAPDQLDEDNLPPYDVLDQILERYIEYDDSVENIIQQGFDQAMVLRVVGMVERNEYKRHQAPVGVRISQKAFGRDRRYPITSGYGRIYTGS